MSLVVLFLCFIVFVPFLIGANAEKSIVITSPGDIEVSVGTVVIMKNNSTVVHSYTSDKFDSKLLIENMEYNWTVEEGTVIYHCSLHPLEIGSITGFYVPNIDDFISYQDWVVLLFDWYDSGKIDHITLTNAINYLVSNAIIE